MNLLNFLIGLASGIGANISTATASRAFQSVLGTRPDLEKRLVQATAPSEFRAALAELAGALQVLAGSGSVTVDGAVIEALRSAQFDHQNGLIRIGNAVVRAPTLHTGGTGVGQTVIGANTELSSRGTSILLGQGASIVMSGDASIKQT